MRYSFPKNLCKGECEKIGIEKTLQELDFKLFSYFSDATEDGDAKFALVYDKKKRYVLFEIDKVKVINSINISYTTTLIVPEKLRNIFSEQDLQCKIKTAFITHLGIELPKENNDDKPQSYLWTRKDQTLNKLQRFGREFFHAVPFMKLSEISNAAIDWNENAGDANISEMLKNEKISLFRELLKMSSNPSILTYDGPYTAFIPSNEMIEKFYGQNAHQLRDPKNIDKLDAFILSYIVPGFHGSDDHFEMENIDVLNVYGDEVSIKKGILTIEENPVKILSNKFNARNGYGYIIESEKCLVPEFKKVTKIDTSIDNLISKRELEMCLKNMEKVRKLALEKYQSYMIGNAKFLLGMLERVTVKASDEEISRLLAVDNSLEKIIHVIKNL